MITFDSDYIYIEKQAQTPIELLEKICNWCEQTKKINPQVKLLESITFIKQTQLYEKQSFEVKMKMDNYDYETLDLDLI